MNAYSENPIITLACKNYVAQLATNGTKAKSWTALSPNNVDDVDVSDLRSVTWSTNWETFCTAIFPTGTVFETCKLTFENGHKAVCLCLDGSGVYTSGANKVYYLVEVTNGGCLVTHQISKAGSVWNHSYLANEDSAEELLSALTTTKYATSNDGSVTPAALAEVISGSLGINADLNEAGTKVDVHPDMTGASDGYVWTARTVTPAGGTAHLEAKFDTIENALQATSSDIGKFLKMTNTGIMWENASSGGGTQLYKHQVLFYATCETTVGEQPVDIGMSYFECYVYTNSATPFTAETFIDLLYSNYVSLNARISSYLSTQPLFLFMSNVLDQGNFMGNGACLYNEQVAVIVNVSIDEISSEDPTLPGQPGFGDNVTAL